MGSLARMPDSSEDNFKPNSLVPQTLKDIAGFFVDESKTIVSMISSFIESNNGYHQELHDLVDLFVSHSNSLSAFCNEIESCLYKARDSHLNLLAAVQCFKEGRGDEAVEDLEKLNNSENPFTGLPEILEKVRQQHVELTDTLEFYNNMTEKKQSLALMRRIATGCVLAVATFAIVAGQIYVLCAGFLSRMPALLTAATTGSSITAWAVYERFDSYNDGLKRHHDLIDSMSKKGLIDEINFNEIKTAAKEVENQLQSLKVDADFALKGREKVKIGFEQIEHKMDHYAKSIEEFGKCIEQCREHLKKGREEIKKMLEP